MKKAARSFTVSLAWFGLIWHAAPCFADAGKVDVFYHALFGKHWPSGR